MSDSSDLAPHVIPALRYQDAPKAIRWLEEAFGFTPTAVYQDGDVVHHAQLTFGTGMVMLGSAGKQGNEYDSIAPPTGSGSTYVIVDDPDAHHDRAKNAGAKIVMGLKDEDYGSRGYTARDPEGNVWSFGTYRPKLSGE